MFPDRFFPTRFFNPRYWAKEVSSVVVEVGFGRLEYTLPRNQLEWAVPDARLEVTLPNNRPEFGDIDNA